MESRRFIFDFNHTHVLLSHRDAFVSLSLSLFRPPTTNGGDELRATVRRVVRPRFVRTRVSFERTKKRPARSTRRVRRMTNTDRGAAPPNTAAAAACNAPTKNAALRERIAELVLLGRANDIDGFVAKFVPRDCDDEDVSEFSKSLHEDAERWALLRSEIERVDAGAPGARLIAGDEVKRAEFRFEMPRVEGGEDDTEFTIDREVAFVDYAADGEPADWRAEG